MNRFGMLMGKFKTLEGTNPGMARAYPKQIPLETRMTVFLLSLKLQVLVFCCELFFTPLRKATSIPDIFL